MKTGLVLEGGAMRGLFSAGVMDVMLEHGVTFDGVIGVSAGAVFGCSFHSGQKGRSIRYNKRFCKDKRYCSFWSLLKTGDLYGAEFCYHTLPYELDVFDNAAFQRNPAPFYVLATDVDTGEALVHRCTDCHAQDLLWMRASASMPLASRMVEADGRRLLDGGIADSIPLRRFEDMGFAKNVVILTQPAGYQKTPNRLMPLLRRVLKKYPRLVETLENRHESYNAAISYVSHQEQARRALVIRPDAPLHIGHVCHDASEMQRVYDLGRRMGEKRIREICTFLQNSAQNS